MGWDAFTLKEEKSKEADIEFKETASTVSALYGTVDGFFPIGGLDVSICAEMLQKATGRSVYVPMWTKEEIQEYAAKANWNFSVKEENLWAYYNARYFLDICVKYKLSIHFSY